MFDEVYKIATESSNFEEFAKKIREIDINARKIKNNCFITAGTQLAIEEKDKQIEWMIQCGANLDCIAYGYALANNHDKVNIFLTQHSVNAGYVAQGYALVGNHEKVESFRTQHDANATSIAYGYALAGNHEKVEIFRTEHSASANHIAHAYALAGYDDEVEVYRKQHKVDVNNIAQGYKLANNPGKQKKYDINCLLDSYLKERTTITHSSGATKEYFYGSFFALFQKSFTQKKNAIIALQSALNGDNVDLSKHLSTLRNGKLGQELRAFIKSGMANILVNKEVDTVRDFVRALQDKNTHKMQPA